MIFNDPLLQGRLFSYTDTQLIRLGGPNFHELPINKPVSSVHNNQRDGYGRQMINQGTTHYHKNSIANNTPTPASAEEGGYEHYHEKVEGNKIRKRSESFKDHFSQATLFWNSMSDTEKQHIIDAFSFELGKVKSSSVQQQVVDMYANVSLDLATAFAKAIGAKPPQSGGSDITKSSPALSQENSKKKPDTRRVGVILAKGFPGGEVRTVLDDLKAEGIEPEIISDELGYIKGTEGIKTQTDHTFLTSDSVLFDALYFVGGDEVSRQFYKESISFMNEAFSHFKPIGATHAGIHWLEAEGLKNQAGVVTEGDMSAFAKKFTEAIAAHRHWNR